MAYAEKFWLLVDRSAGPAACWPWTASRNSYGYGKLWRGGRLVGAHRVACELAHGPPPFDGAHALHSCDRPECANPAHLRWGTHAENMADMTAKGRRARSFGELNGRHTKPERTARGDRNGSRTKPESRPRGDRHPARTRPERVARGERHGNAKLNAFVARLIASSALPKRELAGLFGVGESTVTGVRSGRSWRHLWAPTEADGATQWPSE